MSCSWPGGDVSHGCRTEKHPLVSCLFILQQALPSFAAGDAYTLQRLQMVELDIRGRGVSDLVVHRLMGSVPWHLFVTASFRSQAYADHLSPIGEDQTISQPSVVVLMTEALQLKQGNRVSEIGTGSGYQAADPARIATEVYTIEIRKPLADRSEKTLADLGYRNVKVKLGDGYFGWTEHAPFDAIIITAAANHIPPTLIRQLKEGGRLIVQLESTVYYQVHTLATTRNGELDVEQIGLVAFVPTTGEIEKRR
jgi:protein-L-isoaspartate(D-aspartate) O-methyltransferase